MLDISYNLHVECALAAAAGDGCSDDLYEDGLLSLDETEPEGEATLLSLE